MNPEEPSALLADWIGQEVVIDFRSAFVCLGRLVGLDAQFLMVDDADLHDLRDSQATREMYVVDSIRIGIRRNRSRVLIARPEVVAITRLADVSES